MGSMAGQAEDLHGGEVTPVRQRWHSRFDATRNTGLSGYLTAYLIRRAHRNLEPVGPGFQTHRGGAGNRSYCGIVDDGRTRNPHEEPPIGRAGFHQYGFLRRIGEDRYATNRRAGANLGPLDNQSDRYGRRSHVGGARRIRETK